MHKEDGIPMNNFEIEREARRLRAQYVAKLARAFVAWIKGTGTAPQGRTA